MQGVGQSAVLRPAYLQLLRIACYVLPHLKLRGVCVGPGQRAGQHQGSAARWVKLPTSSRAMGCCWLCPLESMAAAEGWRRRRQRSAKVQWAWRSKPLRITGSVKSWCSHASWMLVWHLPGHWTAPHQEIDWRRGLRTRHSGPQPAGGGTAVRRAAGQHLQRTGCQ